ncbi:hypothetical protein R1flu_005467 [Riccia fluitans]|uniref:Uncharacterized protein n=1 Tax=Riccia fluitans TaxID=41844 RepID=A0ABD1YTH5_9MARC
MKGSAITRFLRKEIALPWKAKGNPKGASRWLPRTLTSMQVILICVLTAILLLKNAITPDNFSLSFQSAAEVGDISAKQLVWQSASQKRNNAQVKEKDIDILKERKKKNTTVPEKKKVQELEMATLTAAEEEELLQKIWKENGVLERVKKASTSEVDLEEQLVKDESVLEEEEEKRSVEETQIGSEAEKTFLPEWMPAGFKHKSLGTNPKSWDDKRAAWLEKYPHMRLSSVGKPRMLLVSGSSPWACTNKMGDHYLLKSLKNKADYCRQHNIEVFYNLAHLDKEMSTYWAKLPILRKLMLTHPEIEWFFWMDADALFTDMLFEVPMDDYKNYNLVMWGLESELYEKKSWLSINDGVIFIRNCQWSLDLFDLWAPMGPEGVVREEAGKMLTSFLSKRPEMPADDQSALAYLLITKKELRPKVKLVSEYELSGYFAEHVTHFEEYMGKDHPGLGDKRWPFTTHFVGCQVCTGYANPAYEELNCVKQLERAFNFADNQLLQMMGFMHEDLESSHVKKIEVDDENPLDNLGPDTWVTASRSYGL